MKSLGMAVHAEKGLKLRPLFTGGKGKKKGQGMSLWSVEGLKYFRHAERRKWTEVYVDSVDKQKMYGKFEYWLNVSPCWGKLMDPYGSTTARHWFFLFVLGPNFVCSICFCLDVCTLYPASHIKENIFLFTKKATVFDKNSWKTKLPKPHKVFFELSMYNK